MKRVFKNAKSLKESLPSEKTFSLTAGCFDLLHVNHMHHFEHSKRFEDLLVVAILSDEKIKKYKGGGRPIIPQNQRAEMLSCIRFVDFVFIANRDPIGEKTIKLLEPSSVVFTDEAGTSQKVETWSDDIKTWSPSTKVRIIPYKDEHDISTTRIIEQIRSKSVKRSKQ